MIGARFHPGLRVTATLQVHSTPLGLCPNQDDFAGGLFLAPDCLHKRRFWPPPVSRLRHGLLPSSWENKHSTRPAESLARDRSCRRQPCQPRHLKSLWTHCVGTQELREASQKYLRKVFEA